MRGQSGPCPGDPGPTRPPCWRPWNSFPNAPTAGVAAAAAVISGKGHVTFLKRRMRMIVQARTPRALSWTGRLGVLSLAALILPLAPTWAQKADTPKPDGARETATADAKPEGDSRTNFEIERNVDGLHERPTAVRPNNGQLNDQVAQAFKRDPEVTSLIDQIKATADELQRTKGVEQRGADPARLAAQRHLASLTKTYNELWRTKSDEIRQRLKAEAEDADDDRDEPDTHKNVADHLESLLKDLGERLSKDLGPVGEEVAKALDTAAKEVTESLDKEGITSEDLRLAIEKARDKIREAFQEGGPINKEARDAAEKAREDLKAVVEKAREDFRQAVRDRAEKARDAARDGLLSRSKESDQPPSAKDDSADKPGEVEQARREVRQMEQQLRQAMRRLQAIERRDQRQSRNQRRSTGGPPAPPVEPRPSAPPALPESPDARPEPPAPPVAPAPPVTPRPLRRPDGPPVDRPGLLTRRPGMAAPGASPSQNPRVERRLRDLEDKMNRLLKELESLKGDKKDSSKSDGEQKDSIYKTRPRGRQPQPVRSRVIS